MTPGPEGERPEAVVVLAALAMLVLSVIAVNLVERDPAPTRPTRPTPVGNDEDPRLQQLMRTRLVAKAIEESQTDPDAWGYVARVEIFANAVINGVIIHVRPTTSKAMALRICEQARRYMFSPNPYRSGPKLSDLMIRSTSPERPLAGLNDGNTGCEVMKGGLQ